MDDLARLVWTDPERMGGVPCFSGTRVPIRSLFDYLAGGDSLEQFLESFPTVERSKAVDLLQLASQVVDDWAVQLPPEQAALGAVGRRTRG
ncbi:MAG: DUF433 domain-containing protein [Chloroflexota bacterium]